MMFDIAVLLTATIKISNKELVKRNQTSVRLKDYQESLRLWLNKQDTVKKIVFAENSGYDLTSLRVIAEEENPHGKQVEFLSASSIDLMGRGIGLGEIEIMNYAVQNSKLLSTSSHFAKVTGRVFVKNIDSLLKCVPQDAHMVSLFSENLSYVDSVLIMFESAFYSREISGYATGLLRDSIGRVDFEQAIARAFHVAMSQNYRWYPFSIMPVFSGMSGTKNVSYGSRYSAWNSFLNTRLRRKFFRSTRTAHHGDGPKVHLLTRWGIHPESDSQVQSHDDDGYINALEVASNALSTKKDKRTARHHIERYRFARRFTKNKTVLDVACGVGYGSAILTSAASYQGVDLDEGAVRKAQELYGSSERCVFTQGNACHIEQLFNPGSFDRVISFETIEHFPEYHEFLDAVFAVLAPGGEFIVSTPNREITNAGKSLSDAPKWDHHTQEWILSEFLSLLREHGFEIKGVWGQSFYVPRWMARYIRGSKRVVKFLTRGVLPSVPLSWFVQPNYLIVRVCKPLKT